MIVNHFRYSQSWAGELSLVDASQLGKTSYGWYWPNPDFQITLENTEESKKEFGERGSGLQDFI